MIHPEDWQTLDHGDSFTFGSYPQTGPGDDRTPIRWTVTAADEDTAVLVSTLVLDDRICYHSYDPLRGDRLFRRWEDTELRNWLQSELTDRAFTPEERQALAPVPGGGLVTLPEDGEAARPTDYVRKLADCGEDEETVAWWLRKEGPGRHSCVDQYIIDEEGSRSFAAVDSLQGVRPMIRVCLPKVLPFAEGLIKQALPCTGRTRHPARPSHSAGIPAPESPFPGGYWNGRTGKCCCCASLF